MNPWKRSIFCNMQYVSLLVFHNCLTVFLYVKMLQLLVVLRFVLGSLSLSLSDFEGVHIHVSLNLPYPSIETYGSKIIRSFYYHLYPFIIKHMTVKIL